MPSVPRQFPIWPLAVFAIVAGIRLLLVARWAGDAPYLDDWNATGWLHIKAAESAIGMPWAWLVFPHAEHLLVTQRLYSLAITALNGQQWDVRVEIVMSTFIWGAFAALLVSWGWRDLRPRAALAWTLLVVGAETMPHAWENLLWAFQIQFVLLIGFSLLALRGLLLSPPFSPRWLGGWLCAVGACFSQASGLIVLLGVAVASLLCGQWKTTPSAGRYWFGLAWLLVGAGIVKWMLPPAEWIQYLHTRDVAIWARAVASLLAWPWSGQAWLIALLWLPAGVFLLQTWRVPGAGKPSDAFWIGMIVWALAMSAASAWARGVMLIQGPPPSRYGDVLVIGLFANAFLLLRWCEGSAQRAICGTAWIVVVVAGLAHTTLVLNHAGTPASTINTFSREVFTASRQPQADAVRRYVRTHDQSALNTQPPLYPVAAHSAEIADRLIAAHRWPATLDGAPGRPLPWLSRLARHADVFAWLLVVAGFVMSSIGLKQSFAKDSGVARVI